jgi:AcrR family transcriptional regulator
MNAGVLKYRISQCAASLFVAQGFNNVVMRDIAAAASVDEAALYTHFGTKQDIVLFIYQSINTDWRLQVDELAPGGLAARFRKAISAKIALLKPYEDFIGSITDSLTHDRACRSTQPKLPTFEPLVFRASMRSSTVLPTLFIFETRSRI